MSRELQRIQYPQLSEFTPPPIQEIVPLPLTEEYLDTLSDESAETILPVLANPGFQARIGMLRERHGAGVLRNRADLPHTRGSLIAMVHEYATFHHIRDRLAPGYFITNPDLTHQIFDHTNILKRQPNSPMTIPDGLVFQRRKNATRIIAGIESTTQRHDLQHYADLNDDLKKIGMRKIQTKTRQLSLHNNGDLVDYMFNNQPDKNKARLGEFIHAHFPELSPNLVYLPDHYETMLVLPDGDDQTLEVQNGRIIRLPITRPEYGQLARVMYSEITNTPRVIPSLETAAD